VSVSVFNTVLFLMDKLMLIFISFSLQVFLLHSTVDHSVSDLLHAFALQGMA